MTPQNIINQGINYTENERVAYINDEYFIQPNIENKSQKESNTSEKNYYDHHA